MDAAWYRHPRTSLSVSVWRWRQTSGALNDIELVRPRPSGARHTMASPPPARRLALALCCCCYCSLLLLLLVSASGAMAAAASDPPLTRFTYRPAAPGASRDYTCSLQCRAAATRDCGAGCAVVTDADGGGSAMRLLPGAGTPPRVPSMAAARFMRAAPVHLWTPSSSSSSTPPPPIPPSVRTFFAIRTAREPNASCMADGMAFLLAAPRPETPRLSWGRALGVAENDDPRHFAGTLRDNQIALRFVTYGTGAPYAALSSWSRRGGSAAQSARTYPVPRGGGVLGVWVEYDARARAVRVKLAPWRRRGGDDEEEWSAEAVAAAERNASTLLVAAVDVTESAAPASYVGFAAATGACTELNDLLYWEYEQFVEAAPAPAPGPVEWKRVPAEGPAGVPVAAAAPAGPAAAVAPAAAPVGPAGPAPSSISRPPRSAASAAAPTIASPAPAAAPDDDDAHSPAAAPLAPPAPAAAAPDVDLNSPAPAPVPALPPSPAATSPGLAPTPDAAAAPDHVASPWSPITTNPPAPSTPTAAPDHLPSPPWSPTIMIYPPAPTPSLTGTTTTPDHEPPAPSPTPGRHDHTLHPPAVEPPLTPHTAPAPSFSYISTTPTTSPTTAPAAAPPSAAPADVTASTPTASPTSAAPPPQGSSRRASAPAPGRADVVNPAPAPAPSPAGEPGGWAPGPSGRRMEHHRHPLCDRRICDLLIPLCQMAGHVPPPHLW